jgi:hypothetical protein
VLRKLKKSQFLLVLMAVIMLVTAPNASADVQPSQSMTHMKTTPGLISALEGVGVVLYVQGGATSGVIGDSIAIANSQVVFHIPITGSKSAVQHIGSTIVFFNTANNSQVQLRNPVIDLGKGVVTATIPQASNQSLTVLTIRNSAELKAKVTTDKKTRIRSTAYVGANLSLAPGLASTLNELLGLPANTLADGSNFGSADVTLKRVVKKV